MFGPWGRRSDSARPRRLNDIFSPPPAPPSTAPNACRREKYWLWKQRCELACETWPPLQPGMPLAWQPCYISPPFSICRTAGNGRCGGHTASGYLWRQTACEWRDKRFIFSLLSLSPSLSLLWLLKYRLHLRAVSRGWRSGMQSNAICRAAAVNVFILLTC